MLSRKGHEFWVYDNLSEGHVAAVEDGKLIVGDLMEARKAGRRVSSTQNRSGDALRGVVLRRRVGD